MALEQTLQRQNAEAIGPSVTQYRSTDLVPKDRLLIVARNPVRYLSRVVRTIKLSHGASRSVAVQLDGLGRRSEPPLTDITPAEYPKSPATTGLAGNFGFHAGGYIVTCRRSSICSCSGVGVLF
jgi:hypothetical protein